MKPWRFPLVDGVGMATVQHTIVEHMQVISSMIFSSLPSEGVLLFSFLDMISDSRIKVAFYHPRILIPPHEARF
jgi:hypothetical protein